MGTDTAKLIQNESGVAGRLPHQQLPGRNATKSDNGVGLQAPTSPGQTARNSSTVAPTNQPPKRDAIQTRIVVETPVLVSESTVQKSRSGVFMAIYILLTFFGIWPISLLGLVFMIMSRRAFSRGDIGRSETLKKAGWKVYMYNISIIIACGIIVAIWFILQSSGESSDTDNQHTHLHPPHGSHDDDDDIPSDHDVPFDVFE